jgi:hypothetical protein
MSATLTNEDPLNIRRIAGSIEVDLAGGLHFGHWRSGYTNLQPGESSVRSWNQGLPASGALVGGNLFYLLARDITPAPYNLPPYAPSGDDDDALAVIVGSAP